MIEPKDVIHRKVAEQMDDKKLNKEIKKLVSRLNSRLSALEKSGLNENSFSYNRVMTWLNNTTGSNRFSSAGLSEMPKATKADYYSKLQHFNRFHLTKTQIMQDEEKYLKQLNLFAGTNYTREEMRDIFTAMNKIIRDKSDERIRLMDALGSDEIRQMFISKTLTPSMVTDDFMDDFREAIRTFSTADDKDYEGSNIITFLQNYDPTIRKAVVQDPVTGQYYDFVTNEWIDRFTGDIIQIDPLTGERIE